jgi:hypothetical protein
MLAGDTGVVGDHLEAGLPTDPDRSVGAEAQIVPVRADQQARATAGDAGRPRGRRQHGRGQRRGRYGGGGARTRTLGRRCGRSALDRDLGRHPAFGQPEPDDRGARRERHPLDLLPVDPGAVGAAEVDDLPAGTRGPELRVGTGDRGRVDHEVRAGLAPHAQHPLLLERRRLSADLDPDRAHSLYP